MLNVILNKAKFIPVIAVFMWPHAANAVICDDPSPTIITDESSSNHKYKVTTTLVFEEKVNSANPCCDCPLDPTTAPSGSYSNTERDKITRTQSGSFNLTIQNLFQVLTFNINSEPDYIHETESIQQLSIPAIGLRCSRKYVGYRRVDTMYKEEQRKPDGWGAKWRKKTETTVSYGVRTRLIYTGQTYDPCEDAVAGTACEIQAD